MTGASLPEVVLEKIINVQDDVSEIKKDVGDLNKSYLAYQRVAIKESAEFSMKVISSHRRLDAHEERMRSMEKQMKEIRDALQPLIYTNRILAFIGGSLGLSVTALIWSLITGRAVMIIP